MTDKNKIFRTKVEAFLHDPIQKPLTLMRGVGKHEDLAQDHVRVLLHQNQIPDSQIKSADYLASSVDRLDLGKSEDGFKVTTHDEKIEIHSPFCDKKLTLELLSKKDLETLNDLVKEVFTEIADKLKLNKTLTEQTEADEKLYWLLWRSLNDKVKEKLQKGNFHELAQKWDLIPADTRVPDHSLWSHLKTTMAFSPCTAKGEKPAFLLFALGGTQNYITTARKTQDLWIGSYIFSYLSFKAMEVVFEEFGADSIVFPELLEQPLMDWWLNKNFKDIFELKTQGLLETPTLPNKFLAILPASKAKEIAEKCKTAVVNAFTELVDEAEGKFEKTAETSDYLQELWENQRKDFLETYYVVLPFEKSGEEMIEIWKDFAPNKSENYKKLLEAKNYTQAESKLGLVYALYYDFAEKSLGSRKSLRNFEQKQEHSFKCTLCGEREALHKDPLDGNKSIRIFWEKLAFSDRKNFKKSEMLCSVCLTKRLSADFFKEKFSFKTSFPSTHEIAFTGTKKEISENGFQELLENLKKLGEREKIANSSPVPKLKLKDEFLQNLNPEFLDVNFYTKQNFEEEELKWDAELVKKIKADLKSLKETTSYYAILSMDGDRMGKWLSGEKTLEWSNSVHSSLLPQLGSDEKIKEILKNKRVVTASYHSMISTALKNFSLQLVKKVVEEEHYGKLVYSGGDDVLALLPLSELFEVMRKLRFYFSGSVNTELGKIGKKDSQTHFGNSWIELDGKLLPTLGHNATASVGVAIAHQKTNLAYVLRESRKAEKMAKNSGRNKFAITVLKRSGEVSKTVQPWNFGDFDTITDFTEPLLKALKEEKLSNS
ncbi:type III-B CRISPR-associated protein Cas10/Cmr2, partial [bacterium]|nr:type III-B CRISPR-associated protein Cas10/Cmr2 [bacterium]